MYKILKTKSDDESVSMRLSKYPDGNLAIILTCESGEPWGTMTKTLGISLPKDTAFVDANSFGYYEAFIKEHELGEPTGVVQNSGYVAYPQYKFDLEKIKSLSED